MQLTPAILPSLIDAVNAVIEANAEQVTALDQAIGDGDHVTNLQRGIHALTAQQGDLEQLDWPAVCQKIGMILMSSVGGASGSLYGTFFVTMGKAARERQMNQQGWAEVVSQGVESVKQRGKADVGEKTMLDVLVPAADYLQRAAAETVALPEVLQGLCQVAEQGAESTRDMQATKGRASFLGERSIGHLDAGAKTAQLMLCAITQVLAERLASPA